MSCSRFVCLSLLAVSAGFGAVENGPITDIRGGYTFGREPYQDAIDGHRPEWDNDYRDQHRFFVGALTSPKMNDGGGWLLGGDLIAEFRNPDHSGGYNGETDFNTYAVHANFGYGIELGIFELEVLPFVGVGVTNRNRQTGGDDHDTLIDYGLNVNGVFIIAKHYELGGQIGYLRSETDGHVHDEIDGDQDWHFKNAAVTYTAFVGYRF